MTLQRVKGLYVFTCDGHRCNESLETDTDDFGDALIIFQATTDWHRDKEGANWVHYCEDCYEG